MSQYTKIYEIISAVLVNVLCLSDGIKILCDFGQWYQIKESDFYRRNKGTPNNSDHTAQ